MDEPNSERAYFRFGVISPLLCPDPDQTLQDRITEQAGRTWQHPDGRLRTYASGTIEEWLYRYRNGGISALVDAPRRDAGTFPGMPEAVCESALRLFQEHPRIRVSAVYAHLAKAGLPAGVLPSRSTFYRWAAANRPQSPSCVQRDRRAFEAAFPGALWQADIMYGPSVPRLQPNGRRVNTQSYLVAVIDDCSRLLCEGRFFHSQDLPVWLETLRSACCRRGIPHRLYCDNGKVFTSGQIRRIGAVLGMHVLHAPVRDGAAKGKIERFFRTVRTSFLEPLELTGVPRSLDQLNRAFRAWTESEYNGRVHSAIGATPQDRWIQGAHRLRTISVDEAAELFLFEQQRTVRKDGTFNLQGRRFEIGSALAARRVTVRYEPIGLTRVEVWYEGTFRGRAGELDLRANDGRVRDGGTL